MKISLGTAQFGLNYGIANNIGKIKSSNLKIITGDLRKIENRICDFYIICFN